MADKSVAVKAPAPLVPSSAEALIAKAIEHAVPIETMERLLAMRDRLKAEQARQAFFTALSEFQGECPVIRKTKVARITSARGSYTYAYAPLDVIVSQVGPLLQKHGLSFTIQTALESEPTLLQVAICTVHHVEGHSESSEFRAPIDKDARMNDAQKAASAVTYAKRYAFCNALGILTGDDDDDAHVAGAKVKKIEEELIDDTRQPVQTLTEKEVAFLEGLCDEWSVDAARVLEFVQRRRPGIKAFSDVARVDFDRLCKAVRQMGEERQAVVE